MKYIVLILMCFCFIAPSKAQTYDELIDKAMDAVEQDSLLQAENYFKEALRLEPANMRNSLLFSNLGTIQRRMGKRKEALESYSLALNKTPFSVTMLLNRASLLMEMNDLDRAYTDYCGVLDLDQKNPEALMFRAYIYEATPIPRCKIGLSFLFGDRSGKQDSPFGNGTGQSEGQEIS